MIVVDSSVWIDFLSGRNVPHVRRLRAILGLEEVIVGDLMLCEVLQGLKNERAARDVERAPSPLRESYPWLGMQSPLRVPVISVFYVGAVSRSTRQLTSLSALGASKIAHRYSTTTAIFMPWRAISASRRSGLRAIVLRLTGARETGAKGGPKEIPLSE